MRQTTKRLKSIFYKPKNQGFASSFVTLLTNLGINSIENKPKKTYYSKSILSSSATTESYKLYQSANYQKLKNKINQTSFNNNSISTSFSKKSNLFSRNSIYYNRLKLKNSNQFSSFSASINNSSDFKKNYTIFQLFAFIGLVFCFVMLFQISSGYTQSSVLSNNSKPTSKVSIINNFSDQTLAKQNTELTPLKELAINQENNKK